MLTLSVVVFKLGKTSYYDQVTSYKISLVFVIQRSNSCLNDLSCTVVVTTSLYKKRKYGDGDVGDCGDGGV